MSGFAVLHRSLLGHPAFRNDAEAMAFAWMILRASWKPTRVRYKGKPIALKRGQLAVSVRDLADAMDRDKAWIERLFKRLKSETMIETRVETGVSVVTICNYSQYQDISYHSETVGETRDETDARQTQDTEQQDKPLNHRTSSEAKASSHKARAKFDFACPDGVDPDHWRDFRLARKRKGAVETETAYHGVLRHLSEFSNELWPPGRLVQRSAEMGWGRIVNPNEQDQQNETGSRHNPQRQRCLDPSKDIDAAARSLGFD